MIKNLRIGLFLLNCIDMNTNYLQAINNRTTAAIAAVVSIIVIIIFRRPGDC